MRNMKCIVFNLCVIVFCYTQYVQSECCHTTGIYFQVNGIHKCQDFFGGAIVFDKCRIGVCNDGRIPKGSHCGIEACNRDGCDCVGGCISGATSRNAIDNLTNGMSITRGA